MASLDSLIRKTHIQDVSGDIPFEYYSQYYLFLTVKTDQEMSSYSESLSSKIILELLRNEES